MSKTKENLETAFAGESQANRRYLSFADRADKEGQGRIARLFRAAAEAETVLRTGVEQYPQSATLRNNLAVLFEVLGRLDEAEEALRGAAAEGLVIPQVFKNLGDIHYRTGRYDDAWEAYDRATKLDPELGDDVYFKLGNIDG